MAPRLFASALTTLLLLSHPLLSHAQSSSSSDNVPADLLIQNKLDAINKMQLNGGPVKVVKNQFRPNDLNALVNNMNDPNTAQINPDDIAAPNWRDVSFQGFWSSLAMIIVSEIGDKTFFIAAIMAMKHSRFIVWLGGAGALFVMTVAAVAFGSVLLRIVPPEVTHYGAGLLFLAFAAKLLFEGHRMKGGEASEELREVEEELRGKLKKGDDERGAGDVELGDAARGGGGDAESDGNDKERRRDRSWSAAVLLNAFAMTFVSEIGDRSQITTIVLAAHKSPYGVVVGASLGHAICTAIAVVGGKMLASRISEKNVTLIGGFLFLVFAIETFVMGPGL